MTAPGARIGPNAIIQLAAAVVELASPREAEQVLAATSWTLHRLPHSMVDECEVTALMRTVAERFPDDHAMRIVRDAGVRTADYLLRARIPRVAQRVLALLPRRLALRALLAAIRRHAWTFAGSARFAVARGAKEDCGFALIGCPVCRGRRTDHPICAYYASTVERLVQALIAPSASVHETQCEAMGASACRFSIVLAPITARVAAPQRSTAGAAASR